MTSTWDIELAKIEAERAKSSADAAKAREEALRLEGQRRQDRYEFLGQFLVGFAIVAVLLAIVVGIFLHNDRSGNRTVESDRAKIETVEACLDLPEPTERQLCVALLDAELEK